MLTGLNPNNCGKTEIGSKSCSVIKRRLVYKALLGRCLIYSPTSTRSFYRLLEQSTSLSKPEYVMSGYRGGS